MRLIDIEAPYKVEIELDGEKCHATVTAPTVDAVPVVRCGECKHRKEKTFWCEKIGDFISNSYWFCADGERKGGNK